MKQSRLVLRMVFAILLIGTQSTGAGSESLPPVEAGRWEEVVKEEFNELQLLQPPLWREDNPDDATPFSDNGTFFRKKNPAFTPPSGYRISAPLGKNGLLAIESYSRIKKDPKSLFDIVEDPAHPGNRVLRIASPEHTDGTILHTGALGSRYQICARVGYMNFGTGEGDNGYSGGERGGPWVDSDATEENGFYFGAIYRSKPMPHNNIFAHHQRILFIDSDNNKEGWTAIWDPGKEEFVKSGAHPVMMVAVDGRGEETEEYGPPFLSYAAGKWQESGKILAVDAYKKDTWYTVCFTRMDNRISIKISGDFRYGGNKTYEAIQKDTSRVFHFNDPHYWFLGDPHTNYYEGMMLVDDVALRIWKAK
ncbi:MAG: hypothetical protein HY590_01770 [Candidatus Omnitrophica bacterium]|nr:hypothetical protein [Candidatus Omnitrophota bacterium]